MTEVLRGSYRTKGPEMNQLSPQNMQMASIDVLPEVRQFDRLRRYIHKDFLLCEVEREPSTNFGNILPSLTMTEGACKAANLHLKRARQVVQDIKSTRPDGRPPIKSPSHGETLDAVTQTTEDLRNELSSIMEFGTVDSDNDDPDDDDSDD